MATGNYYEEHKGSAPIYRPPVQSPGYQPDPGNHFPPKASAQNGYSIPAKTPARNGYSMPSKAPARNGYSMPSKAPVHSGYPIPSKAPAQNGYSIPSKVPVRNKIPAQKDYDLYADEDTQQAGNEKKKTKKKHGTFRRVLRICLLVFLLLFLLTGTIGAVMIHRIVQSAPSLDAMAVSPAQSATYICGPDGARQQKLTLPEANRDLVTIDRIPADLQHAFVAIEDSRFYRHHGIDPQGIIRAVWIGITTRNFSEGASTITQQLLKNSIFTDWTTERSFTQRLRRKIQEQYLALKLEKILDKDQILEDYLNTINLGAGCYGVQAAAFRYFGKDVSDLTLSESAVIAGITQNPTRYNPITNPQYNAQKRQTVLAYMLSQGYISETDMQNALADNVYERIQSNEDHQDLSSSIYTFYQDALIDQVINDLMNEKGYTYKQAYKAVYTGGLRIYSAQDDQIQQICDDVFADDSYFPAQIRYGIDYALSVEGEDGEVTHYGNNSLREWIRSTSDSSFDLMFNTSGEAKNAAESFKAHIMTSGGKLLGERVTVTPQPQASVVVLDQHTGQVKAIIGGRGSKDASLTLNRATYTTRQPGSTFKILTAYAPALNEDGQTLATLYPGGPCTYSDGTKVSNWDLDESDQELTIREAIVRSVNTTAVRCISKITPRLGYDYARAFGITTLVDQYEDGGAVLSDIVEPLALGGITKGVTNLELCGAYACIANSGKYIQPRFYTKVTDAKGELILDHEQPAERTVLKESTAYELTDAMRDVICDENGTAHEEIDLGTMPAAGKTGTTSDYRDIWFAGFTPYYTCCVWGGYDNNAILPDDGEKGLGHTYDKVLWNEIMNRIHASLQIKPFKRPYTIQVLDLCKETKQVAAPGCPDTYTEVFELGSAPDTWCAKHGSGGHIEGFTAQTDASLANDSITVTTSDQAQIPSGAETTLPPEGWISISNEGNTPPEESIFHQSPSQDDAIVITTSSSFGADTAQGNETGPAPSGSTMSGGETGDIVILSD